MASVDFEKIKNITELKRKFRHCDRDARKVDNHSNLEIDKTRTYLNTQTASYTEICRKFDERLSILDSKPGANRRKDRVVCFGLELPVPKGLPKDRYAQWFGDVDVIMQDFDGYLGLYVHYDEVHEYRDAETGDLKESRVHGHCFCIPEIDGKLNGKAFSNKQHMKALNDRIHQMSMDKYGVEFMDGTKRKSRKTVEELKNESRYKELESDLLFMEIQNKAVRGVLGSEKRSLDKREVQLEEREAELDKKEEAVSQREADLGFRELTMQISTNIFNSRKTSLNDREKELDEREDCVSGREAELDEKEGLVSQREAELDKKGRELDSREDSLNLQQLANEVIENTLNHDRIFFNKSKDKFDSDRAAFQTVLNTVSGKPDGTVTDAEMALRVRLHQEMQALDDTLRQEYENQYARLRKNSRVPWKVDRATKKVLEWKSGDEAMRLWEQANRERMLLRYGMDFRKQEGDNDTGQMEAGRTYHFEMPAPAADDSFSL